MITIDDFKKVEIKVGKILSAERIVGSEKLLKLSVDMGEEAPRQILSGILKYFPEPEALIGVKCMFVANLEPREMMGLESNGMLFALGGHGDVPFSLIQPANDVPPGTPAN
jgi:methionine--tRNA ligase beta chain